MPSRPWSLPWCVAALLTLAGCATREPAPTDEGPSLHLAHDEKMSGDAGAPGAETPDVTFKTTRFGMGGAMVAKDGSVSLKGSSGPEGCTIQVGSVEKVIQKGDVGVLRKWAPEELLIGADTTLLLAGTHPPLASDTELTFRQPIGTAVSDAMHIEISTPGLTRLAVALVRNVTAGQAVTGHVEAPDPAVSIAFLDHDASLHGIGRKGKAADIDLFAISRELEPKPAGTCGPPATEQGALSGTASGDKPSPRFNIDTHVKLFTARGDLVTTIVLTAANEPCPKAVSNTIEVRVDPSRALAWLTDQASKHQRKQP